MAEDKKKKRLPWWAVKLPPWWVFPLVMACVGLLIFILVSRYESSQKAPAPEVSAVRYEGPISLDDPTRENILQHSRYMPEGTEMIDLKPARATQIQGLVRGKQARRKVANMIAYKNRKLDSDISEWGAAAQQDSDMWDDTQARKAAAQAVSDAQRTARDQLLKEQLAVAARKQKMQQDLLGPDTPAVAAQQPSLGQWLVNQGRNFGKRTRRGMKRAIVYGAGAAALASQIPGAGGPAVSSYGADAPQSTEAQYFYGLSSPDQAPNPSATAVAIPAPTTYDPISARSMSFYPA